MKSSNQSGQAYALTGRTPIHPAREAELQTYLEGLSQAASPLARLERTHFGRWVIVKDLVTGRGQRKREDLGCQFLLFTSNFDGELHSYLDDLCSELAPEAAEIWGRCIACPEPAEGEALKEYLLHNRIDTGFFVAAYGDATVAEVRESLLLRERVIAFAGQAQGMDPAELQQAFVADLGL